MEPQIIPRSERQAVVQSGPSSLMLASSTRPTGRPWAKAMDRPPPSNTLTDPRCWFLRRGGKKKDYKARSVCHRFLCRPRPGHCVGEGEKIDGVGFAISPRSCSSGCRRAAAWNSNSHPSRTAGRATNHRPPDAPRAGPLTLLDTRRRIKDGGKTEDIKDEVISKRRTQGPVLMREPRYLVKLN